MSDFADLRLDHVVYSTLNAYGERRGGALSGAWFVAALAPLGRTPTAVRQTLYRMERAGELAAERAGRAKLYRLTPLSRAAVSAGHDKLFAAPEPDWDGKWTWVHSQFGALGRRLRDRVRDGLESEGFAALAPGLYVHPRDRASRVLAAFERSAPARSRHALVAVRGALAGGGDDAAFVRRLWDVRELDRRYARWLARAGAIDGRSRRPELAFAARLVLAVSFLEIAWDDPDLPAELLPDGWRGETARRVCVDIYERLLPGTLAWGDRHAHPNPNPTPPRARRRRNSK